MTAYKIELLVLDGEDVGEEEVRGLLEDNGYLSVHIRDLKEKEIPDWDDDHLLNQRNTTKEQIDGFFAEA